MTECDLVPPHSLEAEMVVLGQCMLDPELAAVAIPLLRAGDFYAHVHGTIFGAIAAAYDGQRPHDKIAIFDALKSAGEVERVGGMAYLSKLCAEAFETPQTAGTITYYANLIREKATLYRLTQAGRKIYDLAMSGEDDVSTAVADAEAQLRHAISGFGGRGSGGLVGDRLGQVWRDILAADEGKIVSQRSPWRSLDALTGGFFPGELVLWFGAPKSGKSSAATQVVLHCAQTYGIVVLFALEMGQDAVVRRMLANAAGVSARKLRSATLSGAQYEQLGEAMTDLAQIPAYVFDGPWSVSEMRRKVLSISAKTPVRAIVVDHVGWVSDVVNGDRKQTEHERLNLVYLGLIALAKEVQCVLHCVQHSNRAGYDQEPTMRHIRGGGNAEGHAHVIIAPYRPDPENNPYDGKFLVLANREGPTGAIPMQFNGVANRWSETGAQNYIPAGAA